MSPAGRPYIPDAKVIAAVEEQFKDTKTLAFVKRRRKDSKRLKGNRKVSLSPTLGATVRSQAGRAGPAGCRH